MSYDATRARLETYFDRTASKTWERLTSDAPVSKIRQTVRAGRDEMRSILLGCLPNDLTGARVLDAGAGAGQMSIELAQKGADVLAADISPSLLDVAEKRTPEELKSKITFKAGDMLDIAHGQFDYVIAMDSLIHYRANDIAEALSTLGKRTSEKVAFTVAPKTPALTAMWWAGKLFPRSDRSPAIVPHSEAAIASALRETDLPGHLKAIKRVTSGFYISQAMEYRR
jgi:magnesium-protoporphyrin O-methyltransferase